MVTPNASAAARERPTTPAGSDRTASPSLVKLAWQKGHEVSVATT